MSAPRSWLFVPADSDKKIAKALASDADAIIFDLEDSVAADRKDAARALETRGLMAVPKAWWQLSSYRPLRTRLSVGRSNSVWTAPISVANDT